MDFFFLASVSADQTATANKDKEAHGNSSQKDLAVIAGGFPSGAVGSGSQLSGICSFASTFPSFVIIPSPPQARVLYCHFQARCRTDSQAQ